ncbi:MULTISPECIES: DEAD/DEAH box helicase [Mycobacterium avium complex (MAC)]|uniref:DEAD/DEAH box helicase n=1 Tax=Mycobacterium avium complex (MAC) TaxID=120793 RepID=UPI000A01ED57|nr:MULTISPECIES: DEAD/DEAH box helicase [Mycobacterium avium complex (MAC)]UCN12655.1 Helicase associated domain protein [Mycobacterium intracellulare subsp. chimaera]
MTTSPIATDEDCVAVASSTIGAGLELALRPHQQAAYDMAAQHLNEHDRVTVVLPCGTGKTLLGQRLAQQQARHGSSTILVLVPSLPLLSQTLRVWRRHSRRPIAAFAFCHDPSVRACDLEVPVSTRPEELAAWIEQTLRGTRGPLDRQVVTFATYKSSPRIFAAHRDHSLRPWHAVVADEAHCCAGEFEADFATIVDHGKIPAAVRIFLTATTRVRKDGTNHAFCMDDPSAFGPTVAPLAVRQAITARLLSDYLVVVVAVTDADVRHAIVDGRLPVAVGDQALPGELVAAQLAVAMAAEKYGLRRIMVFHNNVASSQTFTQTLPSVLPGRHGPARELMAMHIDASTSTGQRDAALRTLENPGDNGMAVLSNVRCLSQGVDVPTLDSVVFAAPRTSQIDITQCVGRALRLDPDRDDPAVIVLPVLVDDTCDLANQVARSRFRHVYRTLLALADQDSQLADEISGTRGRGSNSRAGQRGGAGRRLVVVDADGAPSADELYRALRLHTMRLMTPGWDFGYTQLEKYVADHGHARVPASYITVDDFALGAWVRGNRGRYDQLTDEQRAKLEAQPGWTWNVHETAWWEAYQRLVAYIDEHGHARIPRGYRGADDFALDKWLSVQRADLAAGRMPPDREAALRALPQVSLDPAAERWQDGLAHLCEFVATYGHARPAQNYASPDGFALGSWVHGVRRRRQQLAPQQVADVESQPGWGWDLNEDRWQAGLEELIAFQTAHGHLNIARDYRTPGGQALGKWFDNQKTAFRTGTMPEHRRQALIAAGGPQWYTPRRAVGALKGAPRDPVSEAI